MNNAPRPQDTPHGPSAPLLDFAAQLADLYERHHVRALIGLHHWPAKGWRLVTTSPWQRTPELLAELATLSTEHMFHVFVAHYEQGDYLEVWLPLPTLERLGSPITDPITNPTA